MFKVAWQIGKGVRTKLPSWLKGRAHKVAFLIERGACTSCLLDWKVHAQDLWWTCLWHTSPSVSKSRARHARNKRHWSVCVLVQFLPSGKGGQGKTQIGEESLSGQRDPNSNGVFDPRIKRALLLCTCPRLFAGKWRGKGGQGKTQIGEESLSGQREPQQQRGLWFEDQAGAAAMHVS